MAQVSPDVAQRYGAPGGARRRLLVLVVAGLVLAGLLWLLWAMVSHARPAVTSQLAGFDVAGEHAATARFTVVRRDPGVAASCLLRAFAADHAVVGELTVPVAPGEGVVTMTSKVRTERRATAVDLVGCTTAGQRQPR